MSDAENQKETEPLRADADAKTAEPGTVEVERGNEEDISPPRGHAFPIVGIGGSAGGLDAFKRLLQALPDDTGMAFVFVQHLDPKHESQLPEILASNSKMPVRTVTDGMPVRPNEVFVIPPNSTMVLEDGVLRLVNRSPGLHLPIDAFFESLARVQGGRAIAVVLSGNASDGSHGVKAIKAECGLTFAQSEETAQHVGMPRNAIATGAIDYVLSPSDIARELTHLSRHPFVRPPQPNRAEEELLPDGDGDLKKIFHILKTRTKVDFSHYKANTVRRRIGRRMIVARTKTLGEYLQVLDSESEEARELYRDLLISVTSFFRDPEVFDALTRLLKDLLASNSVGQPFRVWVPGCATGEEVYSLAICLKELEEELHLATTLQIFGTDISEFALDRARTAIYPHLIAQDVSPERLARFFVRRDGGYQINKSIRECCVFARQDITNDPPFGNMDLVSCRNLLIYLDSALQRNVLPIFHYSLKPTGLLVLGSAESITAASDLFSVVDKQHRIYSRKAAPFRLNLNLAGAGAVDRADPEAAKVRRTLGGIELQKKADLVLQSKYAPAAVVIDSDFQVLHFRGRTGAFLEPSPGEANFNLLRMARESLTVPLRKSIEEAANQNISVRQTAVTLEHEGDRREVNIEVTPIAGSTPRERYFLVVFEDAGEHSSAQAPASPPPEPGESPEYVSSLQIEVRQLQKQNADLRELIRNANEDHEAHSEELRAANEEIRSANEELQSTNEELSTTKEELQSANEEMTTLNEELQNRNQELRTVNSDLLNLLSAVDVGFLIVDNDLRLRRFSTAAERLFGVKSIDIGYALTHVQGRIDLANLQSQLKKVVKTLAVEQREVQDREGHWFSVTMRPYRTLDDRIAGAVIVFMDIDPLKKTLRAAEEARNYAEGMIETVREPLLVLDGDLRIQRATSAFYEMFRSARSETEGRLLYDVGNGQWNRPRLRELLGAALYRNESFQDFEIEHDFPHIGHRRMRLNARRISLEKDEHRRVLLAIEDVTERSEEAEIRYQRLFETAKDGMLVFDAETEKLSDVNPYFLELTGFGREQLIGCRLSQMECFQHADAAVKIVAEARLREVARHDDVRLSRSDGTKIQTDLVANRYAVGGQQIVQVNIRDTTQRNQAVRDLRQSEERFRLFVDSVRDYALFQMDLNGRIVSWNPGAERLLGYAESEILGQPSARVYTPEDVANDEHIREIETARVKGFAEDERWHMRKDGSRFFASGVLTSVRDEAGRLRGFAKVMRDITEKKRAEEQLRTSLREKEVLLKEIHHRVKNNLQIIASLLNLQTEYIGDRKIRAMLEEMYSRVRSIAAIHELLYGAPDLSRIDFSRYLEALAKDVASVFSGSPTGVHIKVNSSSVWLEITQAVPCGLIVNELLTNSLKHAFRGTDSGSVQISFQRSDKQCVLEVSDDGIGLPDQLEIQSANSMGFQLLVLLVEQLKGSVEVDRSSGTRFVVTFPLKIA
jgi:two-component system CheB/CheR fusion protein